MESETLSRLALNRALLARQMLLAREEIATVRAVERLAGMQAQQAQPPFVGLWTRVAGFERAMLLQALSDRAVVRATFMRGTLHLVTADDYVAFRGTLQPMLTAAMHGALRERAKALDVAAVVGAARGLFKEGPRTFAAVREELLGRFPGTDERAMGYAVRMHLPLVVAPDDSEWGFPADPAFADAEAWLSRPTVTEDRSEELVRRYLGAFGPAAAVDVQAWSGLGGAKAVLERLRPSLQVFRDERKRELFDLPVAPRPPEETPAPVRFLPGFDNAILSHQDRSRIIAEEHRPKVTTRNLQVLPTFLVDGFVAGTWKCTGGKKGASLEVTGFGTLAKGVKERLAEEGERLLRFVEPGAGKWSVRFVSST